MQKSKINPPAGGQKYILNIKNFCFLLCIFAICYLMFNIYTASPVWAQIPCEDVLHGRCCSSPDTCFGANYGSQGCPADRPICCDSCILPVEEEGIINPVIDILGRQPGELTVGYFLATFMKMAYAVGAILVLVYFIWGAVEWLTAGGAPESLKSAQSRISNALIGLALLAGTYLLAVILGEILEIDLLQIALPKPIK